MDTEVGAGVGTGVGTEEGIGGDSAEKIEKGRQPAGCIRAARLS